MVHQILRQTGSRESIWNLINRFTVPASRIFSKTWKYLGRSDSTHELYNFNLFCLNIYVHSRGHIFELSTSSLDIANISRSLASCKIKYKRTYSILESQFFFSLSLSLSLSEYISNQGIIQTDLLRKLREF